MNHLDFEKPIVELEEKITELKDLGSNKKINIEPEIKKLEQNYAHLLK